MTLENIALFEGLALIALASVGMLAWVTVEYFKGCKVKKPRRCYRRCGRIRGL